jgi:hypothetical protein
MAKCGNCGDTAASVAQIRACYGAGRVGAQPTLVVIDEAARLAPEPVEITEGVWRTPDGTVYKVQRSRESGRLYGKILDVNPGEGGKPTATFEYRTYVPDTLSKAGARKLNADEAAKFGQLYGICISCSKDLTDERSIFAGYGQRCAERNGWPWGAVAPVTTGA